MSAPRVAGIILAGGQGRRLGQPKEWLEVGGIPMILRVSRVLAQVAEPVLVVGGQRAPEGLRLVPDAALAGPLRALHLGMIATEAQAYLAVACDMPFLHRGALQLLVDRAGEAEVVLPVIGGRDQPLCALYARACLPALAQVLEAGETRMAALLDRARVLRLQESDFSAVGPPETLFMNVNTPEDLARAQDLAGRKAG